MSFRGGRHFVRTGRNVRAIRPPCGAGKAFLVRAGVFEDVDATLFAHVGDRLSISWGQSSSHALISASFELKGPSARAAGAPRRGRSALDAVMDYDPTKYDMYLQQLGIAYPTERKAVQ